MTKRQRNMLTMLMDICNDFGGEAYADAGNITIPTTAMVKVANVIKSVVNDSPHNENRDKDVRCGYVNLEDLSKQIAQVYAKMGSL